MCDELHARVVWTSKDRATEVLETKSSYWLAKNDELSFGDQDTGNMLIHGDNLEALKVLAGSTERRVQCVFIDPPYNTKSCFSHYSDKMKHDNWMSMMWPRLFLLRSLLTDDGTMWVTVDDNEVHYLKVMMDEVFGETNFIADILWQKKVSPQNNSKWISVTHDHLLCYVRQRDATKPDNPRYSTLWLRDQVGGTHQAANEAKSHHKTSGEVFKTPKPEGLIKRILEISTQPGDLVVDSFLGSGTTAAVAHKMGRRYIGIEMERHAKTHCQTRLKKIVQGRDPTGVTKDVCWKGGGGFGFFEMQRSTPLL